MELEKLKLNKHELYDYKDLWELFGDKYGAFYMWLQIIHKQAGKQCCPHGVDPELVEEYIETTNKLEE